jgi:hypothetical protein
MRVWGRDCRGGRKCGSKAVYEVDAEGTVYIDKRARISVMKESYKHNLRQVLYNSPSSASSRTSAKSYPSAKSLLWSSFPSSDAGFWRSADARVDLPDDGWPKMSICFEGIERDEDTESRIDDHKSCGGASGVDGRESSIVLQVERDRQK